MRDALQSKGNMGLFLKVYDADGVLDETLGIGKGLCPTR